MAEAGKGVRFVLDGEVIEAGTVAPTLTLLQYLREHLGRTGTKEGCAEGDCGACTVVMGEPGQSGTMSWRAVNACIRFLPSVHAREIVTVESLQQARDGLHPVQQAMVDCHASQCGFCTPGFVMSLFALYLGDSRPQRETVVDALAGNLCRCTGYRPIIEAGCRMHDYPEPARWGREDAGDPVRVARLRALEAEDEGDCLRVPGFHAPRTLDSLARLYAAHPDYLLLAGSTDIGLWVTKQMRELQPMIFLGDVAELKTMQVADQVLEVGAAVSLTDAWAEVVRHYPALAELANRFASPPIRNAGTLCGNVANGSPIGDAMPILIALDASVVLRRGDAERILPLESLYLAYQKKDLQPGEFVKALRIPLPQVVRPARTLLASYKISKRFDQDISAVCAGIVVRILDGHMVSVRLAYGGMAATPKRAPKAEAALTGKAWSEESMQSAAAALAEDFKPLGDMRASSSYRQQVAARLLQRFYREHAIPGYTRLADVHADTGLA
jgi:xanthine dehydrogenase small subunit